MKYLKRRLLVPRYQCTAFIAPCLKAVWANYDMLIVLLGVDAVRPFVRVSSCGSFDASDWTLGVDTGRGHWTWTLDVDTGCGHWARTLDVDTGCGWTLDSGHLDTGRTDGQWPASLSVGSMASRLGRRYVGG